MYNTARVSARARARSPPFAEGATAPRRKFSKNRDHFLVESHSLNVAGRASASGRRRPESPQRLFNSARVASSPTRGSGSRSAFHLSSPLSATSHTVRRAGVLARRPRGHLTDPRRKRALDPTARRRSSSIPPTSPRLAPVTAARRGAAYVVRAIPNAARSRPGRPREKMSEEPACYGSQRAPGGSSGPFVGCSGCAALRRPRRKISSPRICSAVTQPS